MPQFEIDSDTMWTLYDEKDNTILYVFNSRDEALFKMADFKDISSLQVAMIKRKGKGWSCDDMAWKELVVDLIKKANQSIEYTQAPQIPEL